ncbi:hypothetical protein [Massilia sp. PWRC2]|uniref:hypothetical protein n=1 Tax=Massilia sp. PWRC2 TaxID=2804626 RepID=UPI003CED0214
MVINPVANYGAGLPAATPAMRARVEAIQAEMVKHPQYEPETTHTFHAGMYCRQVWRAADVTIVGKVHKCEHFYYVVSGTVLITTDDGVQRITGPHLLCSKPGTKRAVYSETDALCVTFHRTDATTLEQAEAEMIEPEPDSQFLLGNKLKVKELT